MRHFAALTTLVLVVSVGFAQQPDATEPDFSRFEVAEWTPAVGDPARIAGNGIVGWTSLAGLNGVDPAGRAASIEENIKAGRAFNLARWDEVIVTRVFATPEPARRRTFASTGDYLSAVQNAREAQPRKGDPIEVRIVAGPNKGKIAYVLDSELVKLRPWQVCKPGDVMIVQAAGSIAATDPATYAAVTGDAADERGKAIASAVRRGKAFRLATGVKVQVVGLASPTPEGAAQVKVVSPGANAKRVGYAYRGDLRHPSGATTAPVKQGAKR